MDRRSRAHSRRPSRPQGSGAPRCARRERMTQKRRGELRLCPPQPRAGGRTLSVPLWADARLGCVSHATPIWRNARLAGNSADPPTSAGAPAEVSPLKQSPEGVAPPSSPHANAGGLARAAGWGGRCSAAFRQQGRDACFDAALPSAGKACFELPRQIPCRRCFPRGAPLLPFKPRGKST